ncbi:type VII secretion protein EccCa [Rhodococcoides kyotonense]|uniref:DNA segregation ATPase FtsK/SpoIIIE, S-DNA-T family n=1 Tax=Rhodococcoides kyotonense TaxID=398843 RepID=A0A239MR92_9NOCA|nr:type VII secretion protein EccCa [Rhodococcus kyotonensis]SNT44478.1 DNA segregation ATPase FtsK/SpoIIIE, S-DNA-T family [Rhodococcus kyotonensis]
MSTVRFVRGQRRAVPRTPGGEVTLQTPPEIPRVVPGNLMTKMMPVVMVAAMVGMVALMFTSGMAANPMMLMFPAMMLVSMLGMVAGGGRGNGARTAEANEDRKDYLRYLDGLRRDVKSTAESQRTALEWAHPAPSVLWTYPGTARMWERRSSDPDFCHVRLGRGDQRLATRLVPPETGPVEELEPVSAVSLRRFVRAHSVVSELPTAVSMRGFAALSIAGDRDAGRAMVRAMIASLCTFHDPDQVRVAVVCGPDTVAYWDWTKWLPHTQHDTARDGAGSARMIYESFLDLETALSEYLSLRNRFARGTAPTQGVPQLVIVVDGGLLDNSSTDVARTGLDAVTVVDLSDFAAGLAASRGLRLVIENGSVGAVTANRVEVFGSVDELSVAQAETVARRLSPYRTTTHAAHDSAADDAGSSSEWNRLLGVADVGALDTDQVWTPRRGRDRLRVPIGIAPDGSAVEIDLKESAENGMGPHGLCIGATGSGKSEFLRTLVLGMVTRHDPDQLNLVLVDFKGGATFAGLEDAPHVAAVITNLSDDLALVDRMKDAIAGEMNRRQELLRDAGNFANVTDYEKARTAGAALAPLPALFIVVDEFSELIGQQPEFAELFVAVGRLGRSLHMHLLLASQRLEEGKLRGLDSHLSYRIGLKTFSANESRSVLGVPDAYHLPAQPGVGYLKCDSAEIVRFAASYVSGPYVPPRGYERASGRAAVDIRPTVFGAFPVQVRHEEAAPALVTSADRQPPPEPRSDGRTVLDVVVDRIRGRGSSAHEVWLPPLDLPPTLDRLIPNSSGSRPTPTSLRVPIGVVDRPYDQRRDLLWVDLSSAHGHVAIVGGPQSGKSTVLRTLIMSLSLTHTAEQVQFYCLDFGGGTLGGLSGLPHVGSVAGRSDVDRVRRTVAEVAAVIARRESLFRSRGIDSMVDYRRRRSENPADAVDGFGDVFLVVDGWASIRSDFESLEPALAAITAQGLSYGVHLVLSASRWAEVRPATKDLVGTRIELKLGDASDSEFGRAKAARVPENRPGRGITKEGLHLLVGLPRVDDTPSTDDLGIAVQAAVTAISRSSTGRPAPEVRMLPENLGRAELLGMVAGLWPRAGTDRPELSVPIGVDEAELMPVYIDFAEQSHFLMFGDTECGKTSLLRSMCASLVEANTPSRVRVLLVDYRRTMLGTVTGDHLAGYAASQSVLTTLMGELATKLAARMPGPDVTQRELRERSWWSGPEIFVMVDDYDLVSTPSGNPLSVIVEYLPHARDIGLHLVVARRSGGASRALYDPVVSRMRDLVSTGLVMSGSRDEGNLIGSVKPSTLPVGRGTLVDRRGQSLVQLAWIPE